MSQEQAALPFYDFMYAKYLLKEYFDITMHEDDYIETAYNIWRDIGNIATAIHGFEFTIPADGVVMLPCNAEFIESVTQGQHWVNYYGEHFTLFNSDWNMNPNTYLADSLIRNPVRYRLDMQQSHLHPDGEFLPYTLQGSVGNMSLKFDDKFATYQAVCTYRGIIVDQDNNPLLNRKEAEAIAYKLAMITTQKQAFMRDPSAMSLLPYIKQEAGVKMAAAKIPEHVTQNEWNRILSAMTRHDRKVFWSSYKSMQ